MAHSVYLGLGSNLGDREANIRKAIALIGENIGLVIRQSSLIETEPWGFESENRFLNGVILVETSLTPRQLLKATQKIERELGKRRKHATRRSPLNSQFSILNSQFKDRPIDIDILLYDDLTVDEPDLKIPHPLMEQRDFVMIPLNEIKPR
ncbi:MAG: 2-amino-4-hydroxy-6-hydroxymethyldihydropteridine diphosphokinase [Prevotella sp.]|nr:2-amino-4-hydroxy-6-hydroxymethyldihydropteridine diphosphokinase [Prevotella sp.]